MAAKTKRRPGLPQIVASLLRDDSTAVTVSEVKAFVERTYDVTEKQLDTLIETSIRNGTLQVVPGSNDDLITIAAHYRIEENIHDFVRKRQQLKQQPLLSSSEFEKAITKTQKNLGFALDTEQLAVLKSIFLDGMRTVMICGFAGSGKTTIISAIKDLAKSSGIKESELLGAALAGKAVQRLQHVSGIQSQTLHSAFHIVPNQRTRRRALKFVSKTKMMIVDESSMISSSLFTKTLSRVPNSIITLVVGDPAQLPPIGPGQPFADIVSASVLPVHKLQTSHRSGPNSKLSTAVHQIRENKIPITDTDASSPLRFVPINNEEKIQQSILDRCRELYTPTHDKYATQIMSFTNVTEIGTRVMNVKIQNIANPDIGQNSITIPKYGSTKRLTERLNVRVGDKVIHETTSILRSCEISEFNAMKTPSKLTGKRIKMSNGLVGGIVDIVDNKIFVEFPELQKVIQYTPAAARDSLNLAWCLTVHKCQGSEFPNVVMPISDSSSQRKLASNSALYTAATRAKVQAEFFGNKRVFDKLCSEDGSRVKNHFGPRERVTLLQVFLQSDPANFSFENLPAMLSNTEITTSLPPLQPERVTTASAKNAPGPAARHEQNTPSVTHVSSAADPVVSQLRTDLVEKETQLAVCVKALQSIKATREVRVDMELATSTSFANSAHKDCLRHATKALKELTMMVQKVNTIPPTIASKPASAPTSAMNKVPKTKVVANTVTKAATKVPKPKSPASIKSQTKPQVKSSTSGGALEHMTFGNDDWKPKQKKAMTR